MARCFYCCHCGRCGPGSGGGGALYPPGWCAFCQTQNAADAQTCDNCGKPIPKAAGVLDAAAGAGEDAGNA